MVYLGWAHDVDARGCGDPNEACDTGMWASMGEYGMVGFPRACENTAEYCTIS
jgi:hypothetical protein